MNGISFAYANIYYVLNLWITLAVLLAHYRKFFYDRDAFHVFTNNAVNHMHSDDPLCSAHELLTHRVFSRFVV